VTARPVACGHCHAALCDADQVLHGLYDKIDLPVVRPTMTRVERYAGHCPCCGGVTLATIPAGLEDGSPFSDNIVALASGNCDPQRPTARSPRRATMEVECRVQRRQISSGYSSWAMTKMRCK
jgi:hypothetical protein